MGNGPSSTVRLHILGGFDYSSCSKVRHLRDLNKIVPHSLPYLNTYSGLVVFRRYGDGRGKMSLTEYGFLELKSSRHCKFVLAV